MSDLSERLRLTYARAAMSEEAKSLKTPRQWRQFGRLIAASKEREEALVQDQRQNGEGRYETERRRLMKEDARPRRDFEPFGQRGAKMDDAAVRRQASVNVIKAYQDRLTASKSAEHGERNDVLRQARRSNRLTGRLIAEFRRRR